MTGGGGGGAVHGRAGKGLAGEWEQLFSNVTHCLNLIHIFIKIFHMASKLWLAQEQPQKIPKGPKNERKYTRLIEDFYRNIFIKEKHVYTSEGIVLEQSSLNFVRVFILVKSRPGQNSGKN